MDSCIKCNNTNLVLNGAWKQCANCGEVHERQEDIVLSSKKKSHLNDIISLSFKSTFMGKLISKFRMIS